MKLTWVSLTILVFSLSACKLNDNSLHGSYASAPSTPPQLPEQEPPTLADITNLKIADPTPTELELTWTPPLESDGRSLDMVKSIFCIG